MTWLRRLLRHCHCLAATWRRTDVDPTALPNSRTSTATLHEEATRHIPCTKRSCVATHHTSASLATRTSRTSGALVVRSDFGSGV